MAKIPPPQRSALFGSGVALVLLAALGSAMLPVRGHLSVATTALVLVIPVVAGVATGGFVAGLVATASGFLVYDFVFIPPYYTLSVGAAQNWAALGVYVVVMVLVARVVAGANAARTEAQQRAREVRRLFDLSELLVKESSTPELLSTIVNSVLHAFDLDGAALLLAREGRLELAASAGEPLQDEELRRFAFPEGSPMSLRASSAGGGLQVMALSGSGGAIGLLALRGMHPAVRDRELLGAFSNHLALALERAQLREQALRAELLEEVDRLRRSLVGAVSHDLRTPLATIKVSATALLDSAGSLPDETVKELLSLIDGQADRLDRLVSNILDMTRIQSGALELRRQAASVSSLVSEAISILGSSLDVSRVRSEFAPGLPEVDVDPVLVRQVLVNLVDNALRHGPEGTAVTVSATTAAPAATVLVAVSDEGPGVPPGERANVFEMFNRREAGGRGGLGLAIASAFVEAHGQRIWVEDTPTGARFVFSLPALPAAVSMPART